MFCENASLNVPAWPCVFLLQSCIDAGVEKGSQVPERVAGLFAGRSGTVHFTALKKSRLNI
ncbi:MAG: hypothetical protein AB9903_28120 [Vulcanimicrobiota bacterium]